MWQDPCSVHVAALFLPFLFYNTHKKNEQIKFESDSFGSSTNLDVLSNYIEYVKGKGVTLVQALDTKGETCLQRKGGKIPFSLLLPAQKST